MLLHSALFGIFDTILMPWAFNVPQSSKIPWPWEVFR